jgi:hypothetical protein
MQSVHTELPNARLRRDGSMLVALIALDPHVIGM